MEPPSAGPGGPQVQPRQPNSSRRLRCAPAPLGLCTLGRSALGLLALACLAAPMADAAVPASPPAGAAVRPPLSRQIDGIPAPPAALPTAGRTDAAGTAGQRPAPLDEATFRARLRHDDLDGLAALCERSAEDGDSERLARLRQTLLDRPLQPLTLPRVLATADVLLTCRAPAAALTVLDRISPDQGAGRRQWLLMQWRAAQANLDHRLAARALDRLTGGRPEQLAGLLLPLGLPANLRRTGASAPPPTRRAAIDLLAADLEARGRLEEAAQRLLLVANRPPISSDPRSTLLQAERLHWAVSLLRSLPARERERLLEPALEQAAAAGAWGLVLEMLDEQIPLNSARALERRLRLSPRLDDAYGEWRLRQQNQERGPRVDALEQQLRSPRAPGGHAARSADTTGASTDRPAGASATPAPPAPATPADPLRQPRP